MTMVNMDAIHRKRYNNCLWRQWHPNLVQQISFQSGSLRAVSRKKVLRKSFRNSRVSRSFLGRKGWTHRFQSPFLSPFCRRILVWKDENFSSRRARAERMGLAPGPGGQLGIESHWASEKQWAKNCFFFFFQQSSLIFTDFDIGLWFKTKFLPI